MNAIAEAPAVKTKAAPKPPINVVHEKEEFDFAFSTWRIARLLTDILNGKLRPQLIEVSREFIDNYATSVLCLDKAARGEQTRKGLMMNVDAKRALELPVASLKQPLVFLHAPRGKKGMMKLDGYDDHFHLLGDGNHRLARAFFDDVQVLPAYVLSLAQSSKYLVR